MTKVFKTIPKDLDVNAKYSVRIRSVNSFGVPSDWSEATVVDTGKQSRALVWTKNGPVLYNEEGNVIFSYNKTNISRTNWVRNPSIEVNTNGYSATTGMTLSVDSVNGYFGDSLTGTRRSVRVSASSNRVNPYVAIGGSIGTAYKVAVTPGESVTFSAYVKAPSATRQHSFSAGIYFYTDPNGNSLSNHYSSAFGLRSDAWGRVYHNNITIPPNITHIALTIRYNGTLLTGEYFNVDGLMLEKSSSLGDYFDGGTSSGEWTGTVHDSISTFTQAGSTYNFRRNIQITGTGHLRMYQNGAFFPIIELDSQDAGNFTFGTGGNIAVYNLGGFFPTFEVIGATGAVQMSSDLTISNSGDILVYPTGGFSTSFQVDGATGNVVTSGTISSGPITANTNLLTDNLVDLRGLGNPTIRFITSNVMRGSIATNSSGNMTVLAGNDIRLDAVGDLYLDPNGAIWFETANVTRGGWVGSACYFGKLAGNLAVDGVEMFGLGSSVKGSIRSTTAAAGLQNLYVRHELTADANGQRFVQFHSGTSGEIANIVQNNTPGVTYNTSSDGSLKNILGFASNDESIKKFMQLQFRKYEWKSHPGIVEEGLIAQEVEAIDPFYVFAGNGELGDEDFVPKMIDYGRISVLYGGALQGTILHVVQNMEDTKKNTDDITSLKKQLASLKRELTLLKKNK